MLSLISGKGTIINKVKWKLNLSISQKFFLCKEQLLYVNNVQLLYVRKNYVQLELVC